MTQAIMRTPKDPRGEARSNVFLNASMVTAGKSTPVRVRNISQRGALVDGAALPSEGSLVHLRRGSLSAIGEIAWRSEGQCGIRFAAPVDVPAWVRRVEQAGQERVDRLIFSVRESGSVEPIEGADRRLADSLERIIADLQQSCERLAELPFSTEQSEEFLKLDSIAQRLGALAKTRR